MKRVYQRFDTVLAGKKKVRVELAEETLARLLERGLVCAADFRCLDCTSKQCLWRLCIESCAQRTIPATCDKVTPNLLCRGCGQGLRDTCPK